MPLSAPDPAFVGYIRSEDLLRVVATCYGQDFREFLKV